MDIAYEVNLGSTQHNNLHGIQQGSTSIRIVSNGGMSVYTCVCVCVCVLAYICSTSGCDHHAMSGTQRV